MGDVLSPAEVESLLSAMESGGAAARTTPDPMSRRTGSGQPASNKPREKVAPYDFKRPERVGKEQMRALQTLHEGFGRNFGAALSALLRSIVEVKLTSVDQLTYSEFVFSLENPTCFNLLRAAPMVRADSARDYRTGARRSFPPAPALGRGAVGSHQQNAEQSLLKILDSSPHLLRC